MNKNSNAYIITYATVMIVVVAALLAFASLSLKGKQDANVRVEKQGAILASIGLGGDADKAKDKTQYIQDEYKEYIVEYVVDGKGEKVDGGVEAFGLLDVLKAEFAATEDARRLPVFEARLDDGTKLTILPLYGAGLWGPIWGYVALKDDWSTIYGVKFDHKGETPGLGAEIATPAFESQFVGKSIFNNGEFVSIAVLKGAGASAGNNSAVDAISGGTMTSRGVGDMISNCLTAYLPLVEKMQANGNVENSK